MPSRAEDLSGMYTESSMICENLINICEKLMFIKIPALELNSSSDLEQSRFGLQGFY